MHLTVLGTGTGVPVPHRGPSGSWVRTGQASILVDCGSGTVQKLVRAGADLTRLDAVLLSHAHVDHIGDLPTLLFALRRLGERRSRPLRLVYSAPLAPVVALLRAAFGRSMEAQSYELTDVVVGALEAIALGDVTVRTFATVHHESSLGFRLEAAHGEVLSIPSDTALCPGLLDGCRGADVVLLECATPDEAPRPGHLCPRDVLAVLWEAAPAAALLTHFYPEAEAADVAATVRAQAPCPVWAASDGMTVRVIRGGLEAAAAGPRDDAAALSPVAARVGSAGRATSPAAPADTPVDPEFRELLEASLAEAGPGRLSDRKVEPALAEKAAGEAPGRDQRGHRRWNEQTLLGLTPSRAQRALLERARRAGPLPEVNLRGLVLEEAMTRARSAVQTWFAAGQRFGRIITGKGKHSAQEPVIKLAVLEWLDSDDGSRWIGGWAPERARDGRVGSVIVALRGR